MTRQARIALCLLLVSSVSYALAPVVDLSTPAPQAHATSRYVTQPRISSQSGPSKRTINAFERSVLATFETLTREVEARQAMGNDIVGRSRLNNSKQSSKSAPTAVFIVVVDAGHGGHDTGAKGPSGVLEKNVVLNMSKALAAAINQQPNMRAILTRTGDYFIPLRQRLVIARNHKADLFVAIHADASANTQAVGASIYTLSTRGASNEAARLVAKRENSVVLDDFVLETLPDNSIMIRSALIDLAQTVTTRDSMRLGTSLLNKLDEVTTLHYKRVQQAPFVVLKSPDIPSVLVETGYITNAQEEQLLTSQSYQQKLAQAILQGINVYRAKTA